MPYTNLRKGKKNILKCLKNKNCSVLSHKIRALILAQTLFPECIVYDRILSLVHTGTYYIP